MYTNIWEFFFVMADEIIGFSYRKPLVILSKLRVKRVLEFGRFCENN